jgi:cell division septation protein DedD
MGTQLPITAVMARDQSRGRAAGMAQQEMANKGENLLETQDQVREPGYVIYVYNILDLPHHVQQTGFNLFIPPCSKGQRFSYTTLPAFTREMYLKPGSTEYMYKMIDGRRAANSLMNPSSYPGKDWDTQLNTRDADDQQGNNLNKYGCFWSLVKPTELDKLEPQLKAFRDRAMKTMEELVKAGEQFAAAGDLKSISPLMHFAMDYLGKQAPWHMSAHHMITCPNCGDPVREGISYHRNAFGEKCIIDRERYMQSIDLGPTPSTPPPAPVAAADAADAKPTEEKKEPKKEEQPKEKPKTKTAGG